MNLIDRYLHEVGRYLPRKNRSDILAELRSHLIDTLEGRVSGEPTEDDVAAMLKEFGPPQEVAASYSTQGQYLVGPALYPLFRMIAGIVLLAVVGAQLVALGVSVWIGGQPVDFWETLAGILISIPAALGSLVIVFAILQHFDVRPELDGEPWDPHSLPVIEEAETVKRGELIFSIVVGSVLLAILTFFPDKLGTFRLPGGEFFANPVIGQYLGWISLSLLAGIALDIYLLWKSRWTPVSRVARIAVNLLSIIVLALLVQGHNAWLVEQGAAGFLSGIQSLAANSESGWQIFTVQAFRLAFGVALIVISIETIVQAFQLVHYAIRSSAAPMAQQA